MPTTSTTSPILIPRTPTSPLDPTLRASLQDAILKPKTIKILRKTLETETKAAEWQERVKQRTLQLLERKGYWKWEDLVGVIVREARGVEEEEEEGGDGEVEREVEGEGKGKGNEAEEGGGGRGQRVDVRVPEKAVTEAAKVVRGVLEKKVELEPEGKGFWD